MGLVLTSSSGDKIDQSIRCGFRATNNEAKYEALIVGLGLANEMRIKQIKILINSQLIVNQIKGTYQAQDLKMTTYLKKAMEFKESFDETSIEKIPRDENSHVDVLENLVSVV